MKLLEAFVALFLMFVLSANLASADLRDGLMAYWPLDGNGKDQAGDSEGNLEGDANWTDDGRLNGAVELDGVSGHVAISGFEITTTEMTCVAWLNGSIQGPYAGIVSSRGVPTFWMGFTDLNTLSYVWNDDSDQTWGWTGGPEIPQNEWVMVAIAIDADKAVSYIYTDADGVQSGVNEIPHIEQSMSDLFKIGKDDCCGNTRHILGIIDEVMIYNRALSEDEIIDLGANGLAVDYAGKLAISWGEIKN
jgi:concanavalin A-like lectin/glucanase superfamily protein